MATSHHWKIIQQSTFYPATSDDDDSSDSDAFDPTFIYVYTDDQGVDVHRHITKRFIADPSMLANDPIAWKLYCPPYNPMWSISTITNHTSCHVKFPCYVYHSAEPASIALSFAHELSICELIKLHPHPNVCKYYGCHVHNGRVVAMCMERLEYTLYHGIKNSYTIDFLALRQDLRSALSHIRSLGLFYTDLNPDNVMMHTDGHWRLIDFEHCYTSDYAPYRDTGLIPASELKDPADTNPYDKYIDAMLDSCTTSR